MSPYLSSEPVFDPFHSSAVIEYRVHKRVKEQFDAFMAGFSELIPQDLVNVFDERELEVSVSPKPRRISD
jgi:HECT-domain (ubiquitin-transferase)